MLRFKQFLIEGVRYVPGRGNVFFPDETPETNVANPVTSTTPTQSVSQPSTSATTQTAARPVAQTTSQTQPPPRQVVDADRVKGVDFDDLAVPVRDASGNITGYDISADVGVDESGRATVKGFKGADKDVRIWKQGEGYQVFGTEPRLREFAKRQGVDLPQGQNLADLMRGGKLHIPVKSAAKTLGKTVLKAIPVIGTAASLAAIGQRAHAGDYVGAGLETASEVADWVPGVGTVASLGIQAHLADRDASPEEKKANQERMIKSNLRSLGQGIQ